MSDAKITTLTDPLAFAELFNFLSRDAIKEIDKVKPKFLKRYQEIENRIAFANDERQLKTLHESKVFYNSIAQCLDTLSNLIRYTNDAFAGIDQTYWTTVADGQSLIEENKLLKKEIEALRIRENLIVSTWRSALKKNRINIGRAAA